MHAIVHAADVQDRDGGALLMATLFGAFPFLTRLFVDGGYQGPQFNGAIRRTLAAVTVEIVKRSGAKTFVVLPKRWIVERTLAWLGRCRRLAKDWECLNRKALAFLRLASIRLMPRKLCNPAGCSRTDSKGPRVVISTITTSVPSHSNGPPTLTKASPPSDGASCLRFYALALIGAGRWSGSLFWVAVKRRLSRADGEECGRTTPGCAASGDIRRRAESRKSLSGRIVSDRQELKCLSKSPACL